MERMRLNSAKTSEQKNRTPSKHQQQNSRKSQNAPQSGFPTRQSAHSSHSAKTMLFPAGEVPERSAIGLRVPETVQPPEQRSGPDALAVAPRHPLPWKEFQATEDADHLNDGNAMLLVCSASQHAELLTMLQENVERAVALFCSASFSEAVAEEKPAEALATTASFSSSGPSFTMSESSHPAATEALAARLAATRAFRVGKAPSEEVTGLATRTPSPRAATVRRCKAVVEQLRRGTLRCFLFTTDENLLTAERCLALYGRAPCLIFTARGDSEPDDDVESDDESFILPFHWPPPSPLSACFFSYCAGCRCAQMMKDLHVINSSAEAILTFLDRLAEGRELAALTGHKPPLYHHFPPSLLSHGAILLEGKCAVTGTLSQFLPLIPPRPSWFRPKEEAAGEEEGPLNATMSSPRHNETLPRVSHEAIEMCRRRCSSEVGSLCVLWSHTCHCCPMVLMVMDQLVALLRGVAQGLCLRRESLEANPSSGAGPLLKERQLDDEAELFRFFLCNIDDNEIPMEALWPEPSGGAERTIPAVIAFPPQCTEEESNRIAAQRSAEKRVLVLRQQEKKGEWEAGLADPRVSGSEADVDPPSPSMSVAESFVDTRALFDTLRPTLFELEKRSDTILHFVASQCLQRVPPPSLRPFFIGYAAQKCSSTLQSAEAEQGRTPPLSTLEEAMQMVDWRNVLAEFCVAALEEENLEYDGLKALMDDTTLTFRRAIEISNRLERQQGYYSSSTSKSNGSPLHGYSGPVDSDTLKATRTEPHSSAPPCQEALPLAEVHPEWAGIQKDCAALLEAMRAARTELPNLRLIGRTYGVERLKEVLPSIPSVTSEGLDGEQPSPLDADPSFRSTVNVGMKRDRSPEP